ncbi:hypothetical protein CU254_41290 (plasmid) [Amycolatopsis sp. AA4]|nr:hypothetical protein CU254_41290 [Amycolatopsis sp. AA4]EFL12485.1 predicted protein [Streptomyces sp. AA4]
MIGEGAAGRRWVVIRRYRGDGRRHVYPAASVLVRPQQPQVQAMCHAELGSGWTHPTDMLDREALQDLGSPFEYCLACCIWLQRHPGARVVDGGAACDPRAPGAFPSSPSLATGPGADCAAAGLTGPSSLASPPQVGRAQGKACRTVPAPERTSPVRRRPEGGGPGDASRGCPPARRPRRSRAVRSVRVAPRGAAVSGWSPAAPR